MAVAFVSATPYTYSDTKQVHTWSHTVADGADRLLLVAVQCRGDDRVYTVTYGTQALHPITGEYPGSTNKPTVELWGLIAPAVGTADVTVTLMAAGTNYVCAAALSYTGVDQASPIGAGATANAASGTTCACNLTTLASASVVVGAKGGHGGDTYPHTPGEGVTERVDVRSGTSSLSDGGFCVAEMAAPSIDTYGWSVE